MKVHGARYTVHGSQRFNSQCPVHCALCTMYYVPCTAHCTLCTVYSVLDTEHAPDRSATMPISGHSRTCPLAFRRIKASCGPLECCSSLACREAIRY